jgi:hypothetical protein
MLRMAGRAVSAIQGSLEGNTETGSFAIPVDNGQIAGTYRCDGQTIQLDIREKPDMLSCAMINREVGKYLTYYHNRRAA